MPTDPTVPDVGSISSGPKEWKCTVGICSFASREPNTLRKHLWKDYHKDYHIKCEQCGVSVPKPQLRKHNLSAHGIQAFKCLFCNTYSTDKKSNLKHHELSIHNKGEQKIYQCDKCPYSTNLSFNFKKHSRTQCSVTPSQFLAIPVSVGESGNTEKRQTDNVKNQSSNDLLVSSSTDHASEVPDIQKTGTKFQCLLCNHVTVKKWNMKRHHKSQHSTGQLKKYPCHICSYSSDISSDLKKHVENTHRDVALALAHITSFWANKTEIIGKHFQTVTKRPHSCSLCPSNGEKCDVQILQERQNTEQMSWHVEC
jgi:hypothetical protein